MKLVKLIKYTIGGGVILITLGIGTTDAHAVIFRGIDFPQGASSFADSVIKYDPLFSAGPAPTSPNFTNPAVAVGIPDYTGGSSGTGAVSLGRGGLIELRFVDNLLTNSGNNNLDLHIFEEGPNVEDTFVAIRPTATTLSLLNPIGDANGDGFFEIGKVFGSTSSIDIDAFFPGFNTGVLQFDAVQLIDDPNEGGSSPGFTVGADIDAVGAISSSSRPTQPPTVPNVPEPTSTLGILVLGALGGGSWLKRRKQEKV